MTGCLKAHCRKDEFAERRGDLHSKPKKRQKFRDVLEDQKHGDYYDYYADYSNAFGHGDYDTQFRDLIQQHYAEDEFYDYEAELQTNPYYRAFSWLKTPNSAFTIKNLLKYYVMK